MRCWIYARSVGSWERELEKKHKVEEEMSKINGTRKDEEIVKVRGTKVLFVS